MASVIRHPSIDRPAAVPTPANRRRALWREAVGAFLRRERLEQRRILADVAREAGVSIQYLSEVERGRKEPSSEVLGAVGEALGFDLADLAAGVAAMLAREQAAAPGRRVLVLPSSTGLPSSTRLPSSTGATAGGLGAGGLAPVAPQPAPTAMALAA
ncbi:helix-turn-helix domain-containing protein [Agromyces sp. MMS24-K17]|uniref:helix-turn-helix domain-containing protein n=1 Tax=Agromyces sp. MMS24-K17 TaxID=3372850 RepID=UPI00375422D8